MNILARLTVKPLLVAAVALLLLNGAQALVAWASNNQHRADLSVAKATAESCQAHYTAVAGDLERATAANVGYQETVSTLQAELKTAQDQAVTLRAQGAQAIAAAEARARDADQVLSTFMERYAIQVKQTACAQAMQQVEAVCPAFSGY